jgi:trigger factor
MDIKETENSGLKRAYTLTIPASEIAAGVDREVKKIAPQVRMPGFRPGKVPGNLVRKMHGEQLHAQVLNQTITEGVDQLMKEKELRPAMQPKVELGEDYGEGKDATVSVELEVLPTVDVPDTEGMTLERLTVPVGDEAVDEALNRLAGENKSYKDAPKTRKAADGDQLVIDFTGRVDGEEFEGGKAEDAALVIGSGTFIPGFEEQLKGAKAGDEKTTAVTFPDDYPAEQLKGRAVEFDVVVKQVKVPAETKVDDEFAKNFGLEDLSKLKDVLRSQLEQETAGLTRTQMKRQLLDKLAAGHDFPVPETMVEAEFQQIWAQLQQEAARADDAEAAAKEIEDEKDDYRRIAERRVRLGLLLSEIGRANDVQVSNDEMTALMNRAAQQYRPEDRQRFFEYIRKEPMAAAQLRAPLYEDKVVDFLFGKAEITEREVTREELEAAIEAEEEPAGQGGGKPSAKKSAPAKAPAKKKTAAKPASDGGTTAKTPAGKTAGAAKEPAAKKPGSKAVTREAEDKAARAKPGKEPAKKAAARKAPAKKSAGAPKADGATSGKPAAKGPARAKAATAARAKAKE